uniref:Uncharacterized protein n=1 Tax=Siphoviridae sp. ctomJ2 TaxID=2827593 RepID=A0A8S5LKD0_9CAUD|nr:MAG TPA: hypothetical protein [Siphoviridae sp. ctomJ2]
MTPKTLLSCYTGIIKYCEMQGVSFGALLLYPNGEETNGV